MHTVIAVLEAKPEKIEDLKKALLFVAEQSRLEDTNLEYRVHQSKNNPAEFVLYENWVSAEKHQLQFEKPYIKELGEKAESLLAKPFQIYMAEELISQ